MTPLYFVPGAPAVTAELLKAHGLDRLLPPTVESRQTYSGPGGQAGILIAGSTVDPDLLGFAADKQIWSKRFGYSSLVGTWNDHPVTPAELIRQEPIAGEDVKLLDGHHWHVPVLRSWQSDDLLQYTCRLPRVMQQCHETGRWILSAVVPQYSELWQESLAIGEILFDQLRGSATAELEWGQWFSFAAKLLAVNYYVDASVLSHLKVLHPDLAGDIVRAALDWSTLRAHLKNVLSRLPSSGTNSESGATQPTGA